MPKLRFSTVLCIAGLLTACATPPSMAARSDASNVASPTAVAATVRAVAQAQNLQLLQQHLNKIEACQQQLEDEAQASRNVQSLYEAGRVSSADRTAADADVTRATIRLIDAQLQLARSGLLSPEQQPDREAGGVQDVVGGLPSVVALLDQKLAASESLLEQARVAHAMLDQLYRAGRATLPQVQAAELNVLAVEKARNDVRRERAEAANG